MPGEDLASAVGRRCDYCMEHKRQTKAENLGSIICPDCDDTELVTDGGRVEQLGEFVHENEPASRSEIKERFGREGLKDLASLLERNVVFEGEDDEFWHVGTEGSDDW